MSCQFHQTCLLMQVYRAEDIIYSHIYMFLFAPLFSMALNLAISAEFPYLGGWWADSLNCEIQHHVSDSVGKYLLQTLQHYLMEGKVCRFDQVLQNSTHIQIRDHMRRCSTNITAYNMISIFIWTILPHKIIPIGIRMSVTYM
jgi:hypothetical protein